MVVPDYFDEWTARDGVATTTATNRVGRLQQHRSQRSDGRTGDGFHGRLGDGRKVQEALFPGELL